MDGNNGNEADEDDEYLTMTFEDPTPSTKTETLTQKRKRLAREAETKGRIKSKAEIAAAERTKREAALNNNAIDTTSKGFKMMAALGYKPGTALGAKSIGNGTEVTEKKLLEPIGLEMKEDRSGIGADSEKKRKIREQFEITQEGAKKRKIDEGEFRERQRKEKEEKRMEAQVNGAMKVCERLDEEDETSKQDIEHQDQSSSKRTSSKPLGRVNVLWRGLVKQRSLDERDKRMRYDLHQSLSRRPDYEDAEEDKEDQIALERKADTEEVDLELDQDDDELEEFDSLEVSEKLKKLVEYLRQRWHYCFWCKYRYPDSRMEGCPGLLEEDHG